jgi:hypothetical protein
MLNNTVTTNANANDLAAEFMAGDMEIRKAMKIKSGKQFESVRTWTKYLRQVDKMVSNIHPTRMSSAVADILEDNNHHALLSAMQERGRFAIPTN